MVREIMGKEQSKMDSRIERIFKELTKGDTSFKDDSPSSIKEFLFGVSYSRLEMKETWNSGIKYGIETGLNAASLEGQIIELNNNNTLDRKKKEFLEKFYKLAEEYECTIQYHPKVGMVVIDREYKN
jgi:hypothetical protein